MNFILFFYKREDVERKINYNQIYQKHTRY